MHRGRVGALFSAALVLASLTTIADPGVAGAASTLSFTVNTTSDAHDVSPGDGVCADSVGQCTLRAAIEETDAQPGGTTVKVAVPGGTYKLTLGTLSSTANTITINGAGAGTTIVQQNGSNAVVSVAHGATVTAVQLTLTGGGPGARGGGLYNAGSASLSKVRVSSNSAANGAGITNKAGAKMTLTASVVTGNIVASAADSLPGGSGGGILNAGSLSIVGSTISGNYAGEGGFGAADTGGKGGNGGGIDNTGTVNLSGSKIIGNYAGTGGPGENEVPGNGGSGGGIYSSAGTVTLGTTTISGNFAGYAGAELTGDGPANAGNGGGIYNGAKLIVSNSALSSNNGATGQALGSDGGGIYNRGSATISDSTFTGNVAGTGGGVNTVGAGDGGAIANLGTLTLTASTLSGNQAAVGGPSAPGGDGGGLYQGGGTATINSDTFTANSSGNGGAGTPCDGCFSYGGPGGVGGGIYSTATLNVMDTTLSGNTVGTGGANAPPLGGSGPPGIGGGLAAGSGTATVRYATVAENSDGIDVIGGTVTLSGTIVADSTGTNDQTPNNCTGTISETTGFNLDSGTSCKLGLGTDISGVEPLLGALAANGGPTMTQALQAGSPASDHGGTTSSGCPTIDQRGLPRPDETADNGVCDIGAYESQGLT